MLAGSSRVTAPTGQVTQIVSWPDRPDQFHLPRYAESS